MSLPWCSYGSEVFVVAVSSVHCLSEQVWINSFRLWFPLDNCFYLHVVFPGSCPLWCSAPRCLLPLSGSLRACPRPQDNLPPRPQILSRFSPCVRVIFSFFVAFRLRSENLWKYCNRLSNNVLNAWITWVWLSFHDKIWYPSLAPLFLCSWKTKKKTKKNILLGFQKWVKKKHLTRKKLQLLEINKFIILNY